jgi:hypothetical protein
MSDTLTSAQLLNIKQGLPPNGKNITNTKYPVKYITTKSTIVYKNNPNATGDYNQSLQVRTLSKGTKIDVISEGKTTTSWSQTPILYINNIEWINKSDAQAINNEVQSMQVGFVSTKIGVPQYLIIGLFIIVVGFGILKWKKLFN